MRGIEHIPWLYDSSMALMESPGMRRWRDWLVNGAAGRVLEIGCGTGRNLHLYARPPIASDPDFALLLAARKRAAGSRFVVAAAEDLPFRGRSIDTVVSSLALCSVFEPSRALSEVQRVLRAGGSLRALEHVRSSNGLIAWLQDVGQPLWTWFTGVCHPNRDTEEAIAGAGFEIVERRARGAMRRLVASTGQGQVSNDER
jgi:ubiquinone/menaquinone biosynthesis C-methylase UbiE